MEDRAAYGSPKPPANPPDLAPQLRPALERLGFVVQQRDSAHLTLLTATWAERGGQVFELAYSHYHPAHLPHLGFVSLRRQSPATGPETLVADTHVRKVADVRLLLLHNCRYKAARLAALAAGALLPAHAQPSA